MAGGLAVKVTRGASYVMVQRVLMHLVGFFFYVIAPRYLSLANIGVISLLSFIITMLPLLGSLALPSAAVKYISQFIGSGDSEKAGSVSSTVQRIVLVSSVVITACSLPVLLVFVPISLTALIAICLTAFTIAVAGVYRGFLQGLGQFGKFAVSMVFGSATVGRVLSIILIVFGLGLTGVVLGWLMGGVFGVLAGYFFFRGQLPTSSHGFDLKTLLSFSAPLLLLNSSNLILGYSDRILFLSLTNDYTVLGIYDLTTRALAPVVLISLSISVTIFPALSEMYGKGREKFSGALSTSMRYLTMLILPVCFGLTLIGSDYLAFIFGWGGGIGNVIFSIFCLAFILNAYTTLFLSALSALGKTVSVAKVGLISSGVNLLLVCILVPLMNVLGAALARATMTVAYTILMLYEIRKEVKVRLNMHTLAKSLFSTAVMASILLLMREFILGDFPIVNIVISVPTGLIIYLFSLMALKESRKEDFSLLRGVLPRFFHPLIDLIQKLTTISK